MNWLTPDGPSNPLLTACQLAPLSVDRNVNWPLEIGGMVSRLTNSASPLTAAAPMAIVGAPDRLTGKLPVTSDQLSPALRERKSLRDLQASALSPSAVMESPVPSSGNPVPLHFSPPSVERKMFLSVATKRAFPLLAIEKEVLLSSPAPILVQLRPLSFERSRAAELSEPVPSALM